MPKKGRLQNQNNKHLSFQVFEVALLNGVLPTSPICDLCGVNLLLMIL